MIISLTGMPCSGKSTVADELVANHNFMKVAMGDIFKEEAKRRGMSSAEFSAYRLRDPSFDFYMDKTIVPTAEKLKDKDVIFDSRVAFHFLPKSFKVYLSIDEEEMVQRLLNSDRTGKEKYTNREDAQNALRDRIQTERQRYKNIYNFDLLNFDNYDLVINTTHKTPKEIAEEIYQGVVKFYKK